MVRVRGGVAVRGVAVRRAAAKTVVPVRLGDLLQNKVLAARHADDGFVGADLVPQQVVRVITRTALSERVRACVECRAEFGGGRSNSPVQPATRLL